MAATLTFFPVGTGDMTLVQLADDSTLLIDLHIRAVADDEDDDTPDVAKDLRSRLKRDKKGRPYVDAALLSHPDKDHCTGLEKHFHLGPLSDYADDDKPDAEKRIVIREMWSSALVFRRANKKAGFTLCPDAKAWATEARRRIAVNREKKFIGVGEGDRILVMGEDENGKTDDLGSILIKVDEFFSRINGQTTEFFNAQLLGPLPKGDDAEEETLSKNDSSVVLNLQIAASRTVLDGCKFLTGGDAEVAIWERMWAKHKKTPATFEYDVLQTPHHCSWHTLSYDSWSDKRTDGVVSADAKSALSQARDGAFIVASSDPIKDDDNDPPCIGAKWEYEKIVKRVSGSFLCTGEHPDEKSPKSLVLTITADGPQAPAKKDDGAKVASFIATTRKPHEHG
ncbi:Uncharacterised protein [Burkholderia pseudomallei]|uniref:hypothetical protein n=1 Tax=Burkholderia pseudomallei TaxID=28450 RepID=UPI0005E9714D|nr:hypothetical protein [Burkholderia pseudomallei]QUN86048.1 metallohydrolase [Burkholderia pseudomallei]CPH57105.1 Uncharacterised protein [Burkholderia pseudomallei]